MTGRSGADAAGRRQRPAARAGACARAGSDRRCAEHRAVRLRQPAVPQRHDRRRKRHRVERPSRHGRRGGLVRPRPERARRRRGGNGTAHGSSNGPVFAGRPSYSGGEVPDSHTVRRGDTLWGICDFYFQNPYQWPRLWSYNPQIKNPHWIYPGDEVRLRERRDRARPRAAGPRRLRQDANGMSLIDRRRQVPNGTVFLRDQGWIHDDTDENWGDVTGSRRTRCSCRTSTRSTSRRKRPRRAARAGAPVFRPRTTAAPAEIVQILGHRARRPVDPQDHIARARVVESLDVIERGARDRADRARSSRSCRRVRNDADVQAHVLASLHPQQVLRAEPGRLHRQGGRRRGSSPATGSSSCAAATRGERAW